jgi:hypothetical protein
MYVCRLPYIPHNLLFGCTSVLALFCCSHSPPFTLHPCFVSLETIQSIHTQIKLDFTPLHTTLGYVSLSPHKIASVLSVCAVLCCRMYSFALLYYKKILSLPLFSLLLATSTPSSNNNPTSSTPFPTPTTHNCPPTLYYSKVCKVPVLLTTAH